MQLRSRLPNGGTLPDDVWRSRHRGILILLWLHVPALFVFAVARGNNLEHALEEAAIVAIPALLASLSARRRRLSTIFASVGLMTASAVLVHLSGGMIEAHFHFFVMVGVVVLYQDWAPFLIAIGYVVLHHGVIGVLSPRGVYNHGDAWADPWTWAAIHGVGIVAMSIAGIANWALNERSQAQLTNTTAMLIGTLESTRDGILVIDNDGLIAGFNRRFVDMWRDPELALAPGDPADALSHVLLRLEDPVAFAARARAAIERPEEDSEDTMTFIDGRVFEITSKPRWLEGAPAGRVWSFHEVTDRVILERDLAAALDKALESSRMKSEFLATMSHEIRTPLNGVIGLTGLLLDTPLTPVQREYADGARFSGEALLGIINDILDFSKIEAGKLDLETVDFDPAVAVGEVITLLAASAKAKGLELRGSCEPSTPHALRGDVGRLRQILVNFVANAVKFTSEGHIELSVGVAPGRSSAPDAVMLRAEVSDSGVGIAEDDRDRLFEPFSQADASTTRRYGGTGLGLAICARLAHEMGGGVGVESELGSGSVFWAEIPFEVGMASKASSKAPGPTRGVPRATDQTARCLLVVEDNVVNQLVAREMVRHLGYGCEVVADGREALAALALRQYDAVLMDCFMPEMDGFEATTELRRRENGGRHTPIIAMTAGATEADRQRCLAAGMDDCVTKPVDIDRLEEVLVGCVHEARSMGVESA